MNYHSIDIGQILGDLDATLNGLNHDQASKRLAEVGTNEIKSLKKRTPFEMLLAQFKDFMIMVLIAAAIISGIVGEPIDTIAIIVIVVVNAVIGFLQEYRAEKAIEALKKMASPNATVIRDGQHHVIPATEIVPGDIAYIEAGNIVPADLRLIESFQLKINESALTGESITVDKHTRVIPDADIPLGDRRNMVYKSTMVTNGRAMGVVVATGMKTEIGKIATMLQEEEEVKTPMQKRLASFGRRLAIAFLVICAIVFVAGMLRGEKVTLMFLTAVSLAVAAIPEALPAVSTIALALGAKGLVKQNALIRKLPAVETLGSVTYICSDKTGTLTQNRMVVQEVFINGRVIKKGESVVHEFPYHDVYLAMALNNDARKDKDGDLIGDPTETCLYVAADEAGFNKEQLAVKYPRLAEIPFDSDRKCMTTFHRTPEDRIVSYTKGAIEVLMNKYKKILTAKGIVVDKDKIHVINEKMAAGGLRVLGIGMREWDHVPEDLSPESVERDLLILGLIGLEDPPRDEVKNAVELCKTAGIKPVMITGDHPITARAIARRLGIIDEDYDIAEILSGKELQDLSLEEFENRVEHILVYARVAPEQKLKIIKALQDKGQFAAMTGDGVNDAPALRRADIGVAMGITGTDVAKEASHMILLDDNFATIVKAIKEGRRIFDNIRKFIKYVMACNFGEIWTIFLAPFFGMPIPLLPIHLLWINLVTDGLPGLAITAEPAEKGIMQRPPRHPQESIFAQWLGYHISWVGLLMGFICIGTQAWSIHIGDAHWQTMVFTVLCLSQMGHVLAIRSERESLFTIGLFSNLPLLGAVALTIVLQLMTIYVPFLNPLFRTQPLSLEELGICLLLSSVIFFAVEIEKIFKRAKKK
ncbi:MAG TPA: cation-translocating P-type ATPase [bacterium]